MPFNFIFISIPFTKFFMKYIQGIITVLLIHEENLSHKYAELHFWKKNFTFPILFYTNYNLFGMIEHKGIGECKNGTCTNMYVQTSS